MKGAGSSPEPNLNTLNDLAGPSGLHVISQVQEGKVDVSCPMLWCKGNLSSAVATAHLASEDTVNYQYFLELSRPDGSIKPCPCCSHFTSLEAHKLNRFKDKYKVQCGSCQVWWCFKCHAPWHKGSSAATTGRKISSCKNGQESSGRDK